MNYLVYQKLKLSYFKSGFVLYLRFCKFEQNLEFSKLLFVPAFLSLVAGTPYGQLPDPYLTGIFMAGTLLTRGAGCTINDIWDHKLDAKVERCKTRPIPAGEVSVLNAKIWFVTQMSAAFGLLCLLNPTTFYLGLAAPIPIMLYPLAKQTSIPERFKYTKKRIEFRFFLKYRVI